MGTAESISPRLTVLITRGSTDSGTGGPDTTLTVSGRSAQKGHLIYTRTQDNKKGTHVFLPWKRCVKRSMHPSKRGADGLVGQAEPNDARRTLELHDFQFNPARFAVLEQDVRFQHGRWLAIIG